MEQQLINHRVGGCTFQVPGPSAKGFVRHLRAVSKATSAAGTKENPNAGAGEAMVQMILTFCISPQDKTEAAKLIDEFSEAEFEEAVTFVAQKKVPSPKPIETSSNSTSKASEPASLTGN